MKRRSLLRPLGFGALITAINSLFPESALAAPTTKHWFERPVRFCTQWTQTCCNLQN